MGSFLHVIKFYMYCDVNSCHIFCVFHFKKTELDNVIKGSLVKLLNLCLKYVMHVCVCSVISNSL